MKHLYAEASALARFAALVLLASIPAWLWGLTQHLLGWPVGDSFWLLTTSCVVALWLAQHLYRGREGELRRNVD